MKLFEEILALMEEINDIYLKLYKLECLGEINSVYFTDLVNELKKKIAIEVKLFNKFVHYPEYLVIKPYLENEKGTVCLRFKEYIKIYEELTTKYDDVEQQKMAIELRKLYKACSNNLFLLYLSFFQESIDTTEMPLMKERLLALKYYNAFTKLDIGEILIKNDFQIPRENYIDVYLVADMVKLGDVDSYDIILECQLEVITEMIKQFLTINNEQYNNDYNVVASLKGIEFMIRACMSMLSTNDFENIKDNIFIVIDECANEHNTKVVNIVEDIIENRMLDRTRVRKISFRPIED